MAVPTIQLASSLEVIWMESAYTRACTKAEPLAQDLEPIFIAFVKRTLEVGAEQRNHWEDDLIQQANIRFLNINLDSQTSSVDKHVLLRVDMNRKDSEYQQFFPQAPSAIIKLGLESQLDVVRGWPTKLDAIDDAQIQAHGKSLGQLIVQGDAAIQARADARARTAVHRVRRIEALIHDLNAARQSAYGELLKRAVANDKPKAWARAFFLSE